MKIWNYTDQWMTWSYLDGKQRQTHWPLEGVGQQCNEEIHAENWREQEPCHKNNVSEYLVDGLHAL